MGDFYSKISTQEFWGTQNILHVLFLIKIIISEANGELVTLLMEKDSLYMEQDSMLVDIEDTIQ